MVYYVLIPSITPVQNKFQALKWQFKTSHLGLESAVFEKQSYPD
jgi:hypothetical protein